MFGYQRAPEMEETIQIPPFPPLTWRGQSWEGEVELPSWTDFQGGDGRYFLVVYAKDKAPPTPEQAAAFRYLLDNEASVFAAIGRALVEVYPEERAGCIDAYDGDSACIEEVEASLPEVVTDVAGLRGLVGLTGVSILSVARDGMAYMGFHLGCEWDAEHGAGVMTHRGRVLVTGSEFEASATWAAEKDAAQAEPGRCT
jgi:hypothetical protein